MSCKVQNIIHVKLTLHYYSNSIKAGITWLYNSEGTPNCTVYKAELNTASCRVHKVGHQAVQLLPSACFSACFSTDSWLGAMVTGSSGTGGASRSSAWTCIASKSGSVSSFAFLSSTISSSPMAPISSVSTSTEEICSLIRIIYILHQQQFSFWNSIYKELPQMPAFVNSAEKKLQHNIYQSWTYYTDFNKFRRFSRQTT